MIDGVESWCVGVVAGCSTEYPVVMREVWSSLNNDGKQWKVIFKVWMGGLAAPFG